MLGAPTLGSKNIFVIPCENMNRDDGKNILVYAPLARFAAFLDPVEVAGIEDHFSSGSALPGGRLAEIAGKLSDQLPVPVNPVRNPSDVFALTVLPTHKCNFSCSYCYSAAGHASKELDPKHLYTVLDYFTDKDRVNGKDLYISFGGGGEPFLSWDIVENGIRYASENADKQGTRINFSFSSNGSVINESIISFLKEFKVKANISFDILEEVHNVQRSHYDLVCKTLDRLIAAGITPSINTVITPFSVHLQEQMVEEIARRFQGIRRLSFDPVIDSQLFENPDDYRKYYADYTDGFFKARKLGKSLNVDVNCIILRSLDQLRERTCPGGITITPAGTISSCFLVSSPEEKLYSDFVYGKVDETGQLVLDTGIFHKNQGDSLIRKERCADCFAKWHCGGGCHYQNSSYSAEILEILCQTTREFIRRAIIENPSNQIVIM
jgi:radical SAM protein with 4Fe4S-binding SPASM domain